MRQNLSSPPLSSTSTDKSKPLTAEESEKYMENIRLVYKDMEEEATKQIKSDPKKAEQIERLGMGVARNHSSSTTKSKDLNAHSAMTDMFTIEQVPNPESSSSQTSAPSSYSAPSSKLELIDRNYDRLTRDFSSKSSLPVISAKKSAVDSMDEFWDALESASTQQSSFTASSSSSTRSQSVIDSVPEYEGSRSKSRSHQAVAPLSASSGSDEAQKKFGSAKAISSSQFFGDEKQTDYEDKERLNRFAGASSLSSDQFFGREDKGGRGSSSSSSFSSSAAGNLISGANLYDMKEGVREGVTRVAGRLSNLASDLMSSVQEKYGGY